MPEPYIGEIRMVAFDFAPSGWALCDGRLLPINENDALFALLGTMYGGDGESTFAVPDLRGRAPLHFGNSPMLSDRRLGESSGAEAVALTTAQLPPHIHGQPAGGGHTSRRPAGRACARGGTYDDPTDVGMSPTGSTGGGAAHENMPPFLVVNFIISLYGVFPPHS